MRRYMRFAVFAGFCGLPVDDAPFRRKIPTTGSGKKRVLVAAVKGLAMAGEGFSIRCPHCFEWTTWNDDPSTVALESEDELRSILADLKKDPEHYRHPKLLRCQQPRWACAARFEAFVCKNEADALRFVQVPQAWSRKRDFRLFKADRRNRWKDYCGILFSTLPVIRQREIELDHLMHPELLSRALLGMAVEIKAPVTVFGARVVDTVGRRKAFWVPIEAYSEGKQLVPPYYNAFCTLCRSTMMQANLEEFLADPLGKPCEKESQCTDGQPPCELEDWHCCPKFLRFRRRKCPCYRSDLLMIASVRRRWREGELAEGWLSRKCWAGLTEVAFPIIVHDHLVGVLMTGQFVLDPQDIAPMESILAGHPSLQKVAAQLERCRDILIGNAQPKTEEEEYTATFRMKEADLQERIAPMKRNVGEIAVAATTRYRHVRARSESVFREEMLGRVANARQAGEFLQGPIVEVLERMRDFWAFKAAYLLARPPEKGDLNVIALADAGGRQRVFPYPGRLLGTIGPTPKQEHPLPFLYDRLQPETLTPYNKWVKAFYEVLSKAACDPELALPDGRCYFSAMIPFMDQFYTFVFAVRDSKAVSFLRPLDRGGVSEMFQEVALGTCTDVVYKFAEARYHQLRERAWREFSALASHRIGNEIHAIGLTVDQLAGRVATDPQWAGRWARRITNVQEAVGMVKQMLGEFGMLTAEVRPEKTSVDLRSLVQQATEDVLPPSGQLVLEDEADWPMVSVDRRLMAEVFRELAINACRAAGECVVLTVRATVEAGLRAEGDGGSATSCRVRITFSDNGPGIPVSLGERVFDPFVSSSKGRTGLGLSIVRRIVEAHGGAVRIEPSVVGATVAITIPIPGETA